MTEPKDPQKPPAEPDGANPSGADLDGATIKTQVPAIDPDQTVKTPVGPLPSASPTSAVTATAPPPPVLGPSEQPQVTERMGEAGTPVSATMTPPPPPGTGQSPASFKPGSVVGGRYEVIDVLGIGGMGVVYRAKDTTLGVEIALKVLRPEVAEDTEFLERFRNELLIARKVTHRNVVRLHDIGEEQGVYYMSMDLVVGRSLQDLLKNEKKLEPEEAVRILTQIARALAEAHRQGVVHRDLKPANILLDADGEAYISDFGIARSLGSSGMTKTGVVVGTPHYLSPEQARGDKVGAASDVYALGIIFVEMLSGKLPFPGGTLLEILSQRITGHIQSLDELGIEVDPAIGAVVDRCLARDLEERYASAEELAEELEDLSRPARRQKEAQMRRGLNKAAIAAAVVAVLVGGGFAIRSLLSGTDAAAPATTTTDAGTAAPEVETARYAVAILPFGAEGRDDLAWASTGVAEMVGSALAESEDLRVVDNLRIIQTLRDLGFEPGQIRDDQVGQLADVFEVDRVVTGQVRANGETVQIAAKLLEVDRPGAPTRTLEPIQGDVSKFFELVADLGVALRGALEVSTEEVPSAPLTASPAAMEAYTKGIELLSSGDALAAAPELERAVEEDPEFAAAWTRLAKTYEELGRGDEALEAAREAVRTAEAGGGRLGYEARAQEAQLRGEIENAQQFLEELVERYPNDAEAQIALAEAYGDQGRFTEAVSRLEKTVQLDRSQPRAWYLLGRYAILGGDPQKAVDQFLPQALFQHRNQKNEQGQADVHNAMGVGFERLSRLDEAVESYQKAADIRQQIGDQGGLATSKINIGLVRLVQGNFEVAEENLREALAVHDALGNQAGIAAVYNSLGAVEEERGRYTEALDAYRRGLQIREDLGQEFALAESYSNVGYTFSQLGEYDNAVLYLDKALQILRANEDAFGTMVTLQALGSCQAAKGEWREASRSYLDALNTSREVDYPLASAVSHGGLGLIAQYEGRYRAAIEAYADALKILEEIDDTTGQVNYLLDSAEAYLELGAAAEAAQRLDQAEALGTQNNEEDRAKAARLRGRWYLLSGNNAEAARVLAEAAGAAEAAASAVGVTQVRIDTGLQQLAGGDAKALKTLQDALTEAERLGHAVLELRAGEGVARAELRAGNGKAAEDAIRKALRLADSSDVTSYAGTYRLRALLAEALRLQGRDSAADRAQRDAAEELNKVIAEIPDELQSSFRQFPEVSTLLAGNEASGDAPGGAS